MSVLFAGVICAFVDSYSYGTLYYLVEEKRDIFHRHGALLFLSIDNRHFTANNIYVETATRAGSARYSQLLF